VFDRGPTDACTPTCACCCLPNVDYCDQTSREQITKELFCVLDAVRGIKRRTHNSLLTIELRRVSRCETQRVAFPIQMRARWVSEQPRPEPETIGRAIIASWWPTTYYWLSTIRLDADSPTLRLAEAIRLNRRYEDVQLSAEVYVTNVYRCSRIGVIRGNPLFERQYGGAGRPPRNSRTVGRWSTDIQFQRFRLSHGLARIRFCYVGSTFRLPSLRLSPVHAATFVQRA
jgi:hypothetical protein